MYLKPALGGGGERLLAETGLPRWNALGTRCRCWARMPWSTELAGASVFARDGIGRDRDLAN